MDTKPVSFEEMGATVVTNNFTSIKGVVAKDLRILPSDESNTWISNYTLEAFTAFAQAAIMLYV